MPSSTYWGMQHINENLLCSIGLKKTGPDIECHEILDIGIMPLDAALNMRNDKKLFHMGIKPESVSNINFSSEVEKQLVAEKILNSKEGSFVADRLIDWFDTLGLRPGKKIIPLSFNWPEVSLWLRLWLGHKNFEHIFDWKFRDVLGTANHINDTLDQSANDVKFPKITIGSMAIRLNIDRIRPETALTRAKLIVDLYKEMCAYRVRPMY